MEDPALPTPNSIVRALIILTIKARRHRPFRRIWRKQSGLFHIFGVCIKVRHDGDLNEAHALQLVSRQTAIPVPKLHYAFTHHGTSYIVTQHIDGIMAATRWPFRSKESQARILDQLQSMIQELRSVKPPAGVGVSSVAGGPIYDCRLPRTSHWGPFPTVRDFHQALIDPVDMNTEYAWEPERSDISQLVQFYREAEEKVVLTHGDLSSLNILVRGDDVVAIVDWETAGWLPEYWEYSCTLPKQQEVETIRRKYFGDF
ncbi:hypothetical protein NLU13_0218 [Sarocladium strictum]|uniref:Aminoglycoside phosphotransferase domain-containing protein n=1 Tax=Sarocladium strictum TaxID=5046 RepID=A0AA39GNM8_SARSR|nr:hypothetical protein NLU13_0218 [Sarocladium strictum]